MRKSRERRGRVSERRADPEAFAERAVGFTAVSIDASSLIVLSDIGALAAARRTWRLSTIAAAAREAGTASADVVILDTEGTLSKESTDRALVEATKKARLPLLSEDRKVLMEAEAARLDCFDALVALELFFAGGSLTKDEYDEARERLLERNSYTGDRLGWAESVGAAARKLF